MTIIEKIKKEGVVPVKPKKTIIYQFGEEMHCKIDIYKNQIWYASIKDNIIVLSRNVVANRAANIEIFISIDKFLSEWEEKIYKN